MQKIALVVSGWHYPYHFYEMIAKQKIPKGHKLDMIVVGHRPPPGLPEEKDILKSLQFPDLRKSYMHELDKILYERFATVEDLEKLGWEYLLEPNIGGSFANVKQWMNKNDWEKYDIISIAHDDNYILSETLFQDVLLNSAKLWQRKADGVALQPSDNKDWIILCNCAPVKYYHLRPSMLFFKKEVMVELNKRLEMSDLGLSNVGQVKTPVGMFNLREWHPVMDVLKNYATKNDLLSKIQYLSTYYKISSYCIEGERGFMHSSNAWPESYNSGIDEILGDKI